MANQERIEEFVSEAGFAQLDKLVKALELANEVMVRSILNAEKLSNTVAKTGGLKELTTAQAKLNDELRKTALHEEKITQAKIKTQATEERLAAQRSKEDSVASAREQKAIAQENARIVREAKKGKSIITNSQLEIDAYNNTVNGSKKVNSTLNEQNKAYAAASSQAAAYSVNTKNVVTETLKVSPAAVNAQKSINSLKIQLQSYQNIAANASDPKILNSFNLKAQETEATISRLSNVGKNGFDEFGNAIKKTSGGLSGVWSGLKTVANVLPGVGIAGLLAFGVEPLLNYIKTLALFKAKIDQLKETRKQLNDVNLKGAQDAQLEVVQLKNLYDTAKNIQLSSEQRYNAAKKLQEQYPETFKNYSTEQIELGKVDAGYLKLADSIIATARARASQDKIAENSSRQLANEQKIVDLEEQQLKNRAELKKIDSSGAATVSASAGQGFGGVALSAAQQSLAATQKIADTQKLINNLKTDSNILDKRNLALTQNITSQQLKGADIAGLGKTEKAISSKVDVSEFNAQRERVERTKNASKEIVDDEKDSFETRLEALDVFLNQSKELVNIDYDSSVKKAKGNADQIKFLTEKRITDLQEVEIQGRKMSLKLLTDQLNEEQKERLRANQTELTAINTEESVKQDILNKAFINGTISEKQYQELRLDIQREYIQKYLEAEIKQTEDLLSVASLSTDQRIEYEKKLADLKLKLSGEVAKSQIENNKNATKSEEDNAKKRAELAKEEFEIKKQIGQELFNLSKAIIGASFENELRGVQDEIDLNEKKKAIDIENVNNSIATEEEKADRIAIINARSEANADLLDQKVSSIKRRQAVADKAAAVGQAIINGALAMTKVSAQTGIATFAFSPLIAALTALQIGTILATPIPAFQDGGTMKKSGLALFGEAGSELRIDPSGRLSLTPDKPTIGHVPAGTHFVSNRDLVRMMAKPELNPQVATATIDSSAIIYSQEASSKRIIKALNNQKQYGTFITKGGWRSTQGKVNGFDSYIKRNFN